VMAPVVQIHPSLAWLLVFLPALGYFLCTRLPSLGFWNELGEPATNFIAIPSTFGKNESMVACTKLSDIFYLTSGASDCASTVDPEHSLSSVSLRNALQLVQGTGLKDIVDMVWRHDSELGRGYLLLSESAGHGRIWRWEVGGGPIAIGKTLHLDDAGCRSNQCTLSNTETDQRISNKRKGSGAMAIDFYRAGKPSEESTSEGLLLVAEWGEGRIVRLEENGARTPIMMHIPCVDRCQIEKEQDKSCVQRVPNSNRMLFTPTGNLIVSVNFDNVVGECSIHDTPLLNNDNAISTTSSSSLLLLQNAAHIQPLPSLQISRQAHSWDKLQNHNHSISFLFSDPSIAWIGGIALATPTKLYGSARIDQVNGTSSIVIFELSIAEDEDDLDDMNHNKKTEQGKMKILFDITEYIPKLQSSGALAISKYGRLFVALHDGVLILDPSVGVIGKLPVPGQVPTAVILGGDGYLYICSSFSLYRIRIKDKPVHLPTNQVTKISKKNFVK
jgi:hypothetical protein